MTIRREKASTFAWKRTQEMSPDATNTVKEVISRVKSVKDEAVRDYTAKFDGVQDALTTDWTMKVDSAQLKQAWDELDESLQKALTCAADRIRRFHLAQVPSDVLQKGDDGDELGLVWRSLGRVGVYAPGGRAAYPSTVLMNVVPAQVAGVQEIALVSPPSKDTGLPHPLVLAAAHMCGITEVYRVGGAQAVAALAYGTETIPSVDKIVGPGNLYVALAKRAVMGDVGIDSIAGPSEVFIIADDSANAAYIAADMLAQAEHDPDAGSVCITTSTRLADEIEQELEVQLQALPRAQIARASLASWGAIVVAERIEDAIRITNDSAPEHLELMVETPEQWLADIRTAGAVFLGSYTPEPVGDYYAGTNHVLPTFGSARYASGLGVHDFVRRMSYVKYQAHTLGRHRDHIVQLAEAEGLTAHARSVQIRFADIGGESDE